MPDWSEIESLAGGPGTPFAVLLAGPPGAGKSTWARREAPGSAHVSGDECSRLLSDSPAWQSERARGDAWALAFSIIQGRLLQKRPVAIDGCFCDFQDFYEMERILWPLKVPCFVVLFDAPLPACLARQALRDPEHRAAADVVREFHGGFQRILPRLRQVGSGFSPWRKAWVVDEFGQIKPEN